MVRQTLHRKKGAHAIAAGPYVPLYHAFHDHLFITCPIDTFLPHYFPGRSISDKLLECILQNLESQGHYHRGFDPQFIHASQAQDNTEMYQRLSDISDTAYQCWKQLSGNLSSAKTAALQSRFVDGREDTSHWLIEPDGHQQSYGGTGGVCPKLSDSSSHRTPLGHKSREPVIFEKATLEEYAIDNKEKDRLNVSKISYRRVPYHDVNLA
jgi:hypothetical protein